MSGVPSTKPILRVLSGEPVWPLPVWASALPVMSPKAVVPLSAASRRSRPQGRTSRFLRSGHCRRRWKGLPRATSERSNAPSRALDPLEPPSPQTPWRGCELVSELAIVAQTA
jgi:hypothetical protein